jgi:glutamyl-tRNA reductase
MALHSTSQYPVNHEILRSESGFIQDAESQMEETIASLKQHFEEIRQREVKRTRGRLGELSLTQENAIESLTLAIVDHILDSPVSTLKAVSEDNDSRAVIETVHRIFSLHEPPPGIPLPRRDMLIE